MTATADAPQTNQTVPSTSGRAAHPEPVQRPVNHAEPDAAFLKKQLLALLRVLMDKGVFTYPELLKEMHKLETVTHEPGARVVARAWTDPAFKQRLLANPRAACAELGIELGSYDQIEVIENTGRVHHVVVCTTCSCVPSPLTGITPDWYKGAAYRTRVIPETRTVLQEFGVTLPDDVEVRAIDTNVHQRVLVLPARPAGTERLSEDELAALVTQESLFGVGLARGPVGA